MCVCFSAGRAGKPRSCAGPSQRLGVRRRRQGLRCSVFSFLRLTLTHVALGDTLTSRAGGWLCLSMLYIPVFPPLS